MKVAILFRGNLRDIDRTKEKFTLVYESIKKLFKVNVTKFCINLFKKT